MKETLTVYDGRQDTHPAAADRGEKSIREICRVADVSEVTFTLPLPRMDKAKTKK
jgi:hypothetical protein